MRISCTYELPVKVRSTPSEGIGPIRKLVDTLLQNVQKDHNNNEFQCNKFKQHVNKTPF